MRSSALWFPFLALLSGPHLISATIFPDPAPYAEQLSYDPFSDYPAIPVAEEPSSSDSEASILPLSKPLGNIAGLAIDSKGNVVAFHRADRVWDEKTFNEKNVFNRKLGLIPNSTIAVINPENGQVVSEHGENLFYLPHGLAIDDEGNHWVTDVGSHQVHKLDKNFRPIMSLGEALVPGSDDKHFCKPTDIAVAKNGFFFVADGYCNSRVMKFNPQGKLVDEFGAAAVADEAEPSDFLIPHSLALIEDMNMICVADRENERVQCYSAGLAEGHRTIPTGIPITSADDIGRVFAIREKKHYLVGVTGMGNGPVEPQLFVMDMNNGKANTFVEGIENVHALAVSDDGTVFMAQMNPNQIVQISLPEQL
ncbi:unnamed protein product [Auanema sp. JU1783]|nr:unnamed protein product [Auanema sp. JU1783]